MFECYGAYGNASTNHKAIIIIQFNHFCIQFPSATACDHKVLHGDNVYNS